MMTLVRHKKRTVFVAFVCIAALMVLSLRCGYLMIIKSEYYSKLATDVHERERLVKAKRGRILDINGNIIAANKTVCTVSVIHNQIIDPQKVIDTLSELLDISRDKVEKKVNKYSSIEKIKSNVDKQLGDKIRELDLAGVKVDDDYRRYYIYDELASKVIGFTGSDNQGVIGLEAYYDNILSGESGTILTTTDAKGVEIASAKENRIESRMGCDLITSLDINIQAYATQLAKKTMEAKEAKQVSIIVMRPDNGEILAMANVPEYNLNNPFLDNTLSQDELNQMWRNTCINDTYEPGSIFKTVTATAALETKSVSLNDTYVCPGFKIVKDRRIKCHKTIGHGYQTFTESVLNSCNPAFIEWGQRVGASNLYAYMEKLGLMEKTGIDVAGEGKIIVHKLENVGPVELATMSFGQSFQVTPIQMLRAVTAIINGGRLVTPHFGVSIVDNDGNKTEIEYNNKVAIEKETSDIMKNIMKSVVNEGGGNKAYIEEYSIGGKTATSEKLPRNQGKYIASFIGFAPVEAPKVIAMCIIDEPKGVYYGGSIAAPVIKELYENILPYLEIEKTTGGENEEN